MFLLFNYIKLGGIGILAACFSITAGLSCYNCHHNGPDDLSTILNVTNAIPPFKNCALDKDGEKPGPGQTQVCQLNELACAKTRLSMNMIPWGPSAGVGSNIIYSTFTMRNCTAAPIPKEGQRCFNISGDFETEFVKKNSNPPKTLTYKIEYKGERCMCEADTCNEQPGKEMVEPESVSVKKSKSNYIQSSLLTTISVGVAILFLTQAIINFHTY